MFFTVRKNLKIAGKHYRPCVCYELPSYLLPTVRGLAEKGIASMTEDAVFFQNGARIEPKAEKKEENADIKAEIAEKPQKKAEKQHKASENEAKCDENAGSGDEKPDTEGF